MNPKIPKPHDKLFREIWSDRTVALDFLQNYLPKDLLSITDLSTLEISKDTFVEKRLRDYYSDILYRVALSGHPGFLYLLFEHKSHPYRWIHLQLQGYMLNIWNLLLKQEKKTRLLPAVVPLVIYHGNEAWGQKRRFREIIAGPVEKLRPYIPDFEYILYDLSRYTDEQIRGGVLLQAYLLIVRDITKPDIRGRLPRIFKFLAELTDSESGLRALEVLLRYLFNQVPDLKKEEAEEMMGEEITEKKKEVFMTVAEQLRKEGFEKGVQLGELEGARKELLGMIEQGVNIRFGSEGAKLMPRLRKIRKIEQLRTIQAMLYTVKDLSEFHQTMAPKLPKREPSPSFDADET